MLTKANTTLHLLLPIMALDKLSIYYYVAGVLNILGNVYMQLHVVLHGMDLLIIIKPAMHYILL